MRRIQRQARNTDGRDLAVGDIHGHAGRLQQALDRVGFDRARDRLFSVGDLVDRGPDSASAVGLLAERWFYAVRGNHDLSVLASFAAERDPDTAGDNRFRLACDTHAWMMALPAAVRECVIERLLALPYALEIETEDGLVAIVHGGIPEGFATWRAFVDELEDERTGTDLRHECCWDRSSAARARPLDAPDTPADERARLPDIAHVIHGHTPLADSNEGVFVGRLANRYWIDTGGWLESGVGESWPLPPRFTLVDIRYPEVPL